MVVPGRGREQEQGLPECVELKLLVDPVADDVGAAGIPRQGQFPFVGDIVFQDRVGGLELGDPSASSLAVMKRTASSISGYGPAAATAWPANAWSRIQA